MVGLIEEEHQIIRETVQMILEFHLGAEMEQNAQETDEIELPISNNEEVVTQLATQNVEILYLLKKISYLRAHPSRRLSGLPAEWSKDHQVDKR
uniref:Uncharacterized protein n=1 Tax=Romanomermis culicivorax TaxID=13658 RepID=A0A915LBQ0_ROMCU